MAETKLTVSIVIGDVSRRDAISTACLQKVEAMRRYCRANAIALQLRVFTTASDIDDTAIHLATHASQIVHDSHFLGSDLILYEYGIYYGLFDSILLAPRSARLVVSHHGISPPFLYDDEVNRALVRSHHQINNVLLADLVLADSLYIADWLIQIGVAPERVERIGLPAFCDEPPPVTRCREFKDEPRLLYVGRFVRAKGVLELVQALARVKASTSFRPKLSLVGSLRFSDQAYLAQIRRVLKESGLGDAVTFRFDVPQDTLLAEFDAADALVIPSHHEGLCLPVIEAYHRHCPVIASDAAALPETTAGLGYLFRTGRVDDLATRLTEFLEARRKGMILTVRGSITPEDWTESVNRYIGWFSRDAYESRLLAALLNGLERRVSSEHRSWLTLASQDMLARVRSEPPLATDNPLDRKLDRVLATTVVPHDVLSADLLGTVSGNGQTPGVNAMTAPPSYNQLRWMSFKRRVKSIPVLGKAAVRGKRIIVPALRQTRSACIRLTGLDRPSGQLAALLEPLSRSLDARLLPLHSQAAELSSRLDALALALALQVDHLEQLRDQIATLQCSGEQHLHQLVGLTAMIDILARKNQMLALDVREWNAARGGRKHLAEPRILDPAEHARKIQELGGVIRLNLGCGEKPLRGYINVDARELPDVDVIADACNLPYGPDSVQEIVSAHLVEHFREHQFRQTILPYWTSLLTDGGVLRIICPNWAAMIRRLQEGRMSYQHFRTVTFGAQDYAGDDHFAMYTPEALAALLGEAGYHHIEQVAEERINGLCPEMELTAVRAPRHGQNGAADGKPPAFRRVAPATLEAQAD